LTNIPLLEYVAKKGKPVMISIGAASHDEVKEAVATLSSFTDKLVLMHCHLKYPTEPKQANLAVITTLKKQFPVAIIGYSDHTEHPYDAPVAAVSLGAKVLEKHITLDKTMEGPDHFFALDPGELKLMVEKVREAEEKIRHGNSVGIKNVLLGSPEIRTHEDEGYLRNFAYQTILSIKRIPGGERLTRENIRILRPGNIPWGIEPKHYPSLIKKNYIAQRDIDEGESIHWSDLIEK
jgi:sialic acid synthase SpsE